MRSSTIIQNKSLVTFQVFGDLKQFLAPTRRQKQRFTIELNGNPAIKDTIESLGIPHTEIDGITVDGRFKRFHYQIKGGETICLYPDLTSVRLKKKIPLQPKTPAHPKFILDVHLGKLARYLRLLGFDVAYEKDLSDRQIVDRVVKEKRVVLTRDVGLLKHRLIHRGYFVRHTDFLQQVNEILSRFSLKKKIHAFTRCLECNGKIGRARLEDISGLLNPDTLMYYNEFYQCRDCKRVFWQGSHYQTLSNRVKIMMGFTPK